MHRTSIVEAIRARGMIFYGMNYNLNIKSLSRNLIDSVSGKAEYYDSSLSFSYFLNTKIIFVTQDQRLKYYRHHLRSELLRCRPTPVQHKPE